MKDTEVLSAEYADEEQTKRDQDRQYVHEWKTLEKQAIEGRRKHDWEWLVRTLYVRGYHFGRYNRSTNTIVFSTRTGVKIPVNLVAAHLRGVRNQITSFQPKWEVLPRVTTERAFENARYSGKALDYIYEQGQIKRKIKESVNDALITSIGIWYFDINKAKDIVVSRIDPFDFYTDPNIKSPNINDPEYGAEYVLLMNQVSLDSIKKNPEFENTDQIQHDNLTAAAEYKQFLHQVTRYEAGIGKELNETVILKHIWRRERQENGEIKIRAGVYVDQVDRPLFNELLDEDEFPFEVLQGDIAGGELYGEAWVKNIIPINRVIDALESYIFEYNHMFAKGKWVIDKNSGVRLIVNQNGQIIEKNRGAQIQAVTVPPLPPSPMEQLNNMQRYMEDISGVHDVSLGRLPAGVKSGVAIAELRQSDATNQSDLVDNLEDFLSRAGRRILKLAAENWNSTKLISVTDTVGKPEYFMAIGEKGSTKAKKFTYGDKELPLAVIGADNEVRVQIGSWLAYTKEARQEKLKELYRLGAIDQQTYLQHAEFADIDGIIKRTREEQVFQTRSGARSQAIQKQYGIEMTDEELALAENSLMVLDGIEQHAEPGDDHALHLLIHKEEADSPLVKKHIAEHMDYQKWERSMSTRRVPQENNQAILDQSLALPGQLEGMLPPPPPQAPQSVGGAVEGFEMRPPIGPGAPPFNSDADIIQ